MYREPIRGVGIKNRVLGIKPIVYIAEIGEGKKS
jgi:hypothetical protein